MCVCVGRGGILGGFIPGTVCPGVQERAAFLSCSPLILSLAGLLCDLLWSDPDKDVQGWGENDRGVSFTFGADVVSKFLNRHDLDLICRAHQVGISPSLLTRSLCRW